MRNGGRRAGDAVGKAVAGVCHHDVEIVAKVLRERLYFLAWLAAQGLAGQAVPLQQAHGQLPTRWRAPVKALNRVVLPQLGLPTKAMA